MTCKDFIFKLMKWSFHSNDLHIFLSIFVQFKNEECFLAWSLNAPQARASLLEVEMLL